MKTTQVVYELGDLSSWVGAAATLAAVGVALWIANRDRRTFMQEAADRWELERLVELAEATSHGGRDLTQTTPDVEDKEKERSARRRVLRYALCGRERFPVSLEGDRHPSREQLRQVAGSTTKPWHTRAEAELAVAVMDAADRYRKSSVRSRR